jgi:hypothetical protein
MKKIKLLLLLLYFSIIGFSQTNTIILKAIDSKGQIDSVIMGYRDNATVGIDADFGESDYFYKPYSDIDIRSIQRDSITKDSIWLFSNNGSHIVNPFSKNIDLKKDFRSLYSYGDHFIVQVYAINYPITLKIEYINFSQDVPYCSYLNSIEDETVKGELKYLYYQNKDTIVEFSSPVVNRLIGFHPQYIESVIQVDAKTKMSIYPNPVVDDLTINSTTYSNERIIIYNSSGCIIEQFDFRGKTMNINFSNYPIGLYLIRMGSNFEKFIKL